MPESLRSILSDDSGQGLAEYGIILGLIALVCVATLFLIGTNLSNVFNSVATEL